MHQEHNIPWTSLADHLKFVRNDTRFTPPRSGIITISSPTQANFFAHFCRTFASVTSEFARTERTKYPSPEAYREMAMRTSQGNLFDDSLIILYPEFLDQRNQKIENWLPRVQLPSSQSANPNVPPIHGELENGAKADVIKILLQESVLDKSGSMRRPSSNGKGDQVISQCIDRLLLLANHPSISMRSLHNLSWGHHFGFSRIMESCTASYLYLNIADAMGHLWDDGSSDNTQAASSISSLTSYQNFVRFYLTASMDYPGQQIIHQLYFFDQADLLDQDDCKYVKDAFDISGPSDNKQQRLQKLQKYLKQMFEVLYRYELVARECGVAVDIEAEVIHWMKTITGCNIEFKYTEGSGEYRPVFI